MLEGIERLLKKETGTKIQNHRIYEDRLNEI